MSWDSGQNTNDNWAAASREDDSGFTPPPANDNGNNGGSGFNSVGGGDFGGGGGGGCHNCGQEGHFKSECTEPRKAREPPPGACRNCGQEGHYKSDCTEPEKVVTCSQCQQEGHIARSCPNSLCLFCKQEGHTMNDCGGRVNAPCRNCQQPGHEARDCTNLRNEDTSHLMEATQDEAWALLVKASVAKDLDEFKEAFWIYAKACPEAKVWELNEAFRRENLFYCVVAVEKELGNSQTIVGLQGDVKDMKYVATFQKTLKGRRALLAKDGRYPQTQEENDARLKQAGFVKESFVPWCANCGEKGHGSHSCPEDPVPKEFEKPEIKCIVCSDIGHRARDCTQERKPEYDPNACRNCGKPGHNSKECEEPRDMSGVTCRKCEKTGHFSKDCPDAPKMACHNCGEEGHRSSECTNPRKFTCRNCDKDGHQARNCPQPKNEAKVQCRNCEQIGHFTKNCKEPKNMNNVTCNRCQKRGHMSKGCTNPAASKYEADNVPYGDIGGPVQTATFNEEPATTTTGTWGADEPAVESNGG